MFSWGFREESAALVKELWRDSCESYCLWTRLPSSIYLSILHPSLPHSLSLSFTHCPCLPPFLQLSHSSSLLRVLLFRLFSFCPFFSFLCHPALFCSLTVCPPVCTKSSLFSVMTHSLSLFYLYVLTSLMFGCVNPPPPILFVCINTPPPLSL